MRSIVSAQRIILLLVGALAFSVAANAQELQIFISGIAFSPQRIGAHVGDRITWINNDGVRHEIFFERNPTDSAGSRLRYQLRPEQSVSIIVSNPGDYDYVCRWHGMSGSIHIE
jgi:plastocyanin